MTVICPNEQFYNEVYYKWTVITLSEIKRDFPMEFPFFDSKT